MDFRKVASTWDTYNYEEAVLEDVKEAILERLREGNYVDYDDLEDAQDEIQEDLWADDGVTGNASGSYTFNTFMAELYLVNNGNLYGEALEELGGKYDSSPEARDVTIRCYLLGNAISEALASEDILAAFEEAKKEAEGQD
jgi:hypothetical protein